MITGGAGGPEQGTHAGQEKERRTKIPGRMSECPGPRLRTHAQAQGRGQGEVAACAARWPEGGRGRARAKQRLRRGLGTHQNGNAQKGNVGETWDSHAREEAGRRARGPSGHRAHSCISPPGLPHQEAVGQPQPSCGQANSTHPLGEKNEDRCCRASHLAPNTFSLPSHYDQGPSGKATGPSAGNAG